MKFKKLLMPLAASAAVVAATVPLITSCGSGYNFTIGNDEYKSSFNDEDLPTTFQEGTDPTKAYLELVKENPKIFADDWVYRLFYYEVKGTHYIERNANFTFDVTGVDPDAHTVDFSFSMSHSHYVMNGASYGGTTLVSDSTMECSVNGFKIQVLKDTTHEYTSDYEIDVDKAWVPTIGVFDENIKMKGTNKLVLDGKTINETHDYSIGLQGLIRLLAANFDIILDLYNPPAKIEIFGSHYLEKVHG